jgi:hypothetical protein
MRLVDGAASSVGRTGGSILHTSYRRCSAGATIRCAACPYAGYTTERTALANSTSCPTSSLPGVRSSRMRSGTSDSSRHCARSADGVRRPAFSRAKVTVDKRSRVELRPAYGLP